MGIPIFDEVVYSTDQYFDVQTDNLMDQTVKLTQYANLGSNLELGKQFSVSIPTASPKLSCHIVCLLGYQKRSFNSCNFRSSYILTKRYTLDRFGSHLGDGQIWFSNLP